MCESTTFKKKIISKTPEVRRVEKKAVDGENENYHSADFQQEKLIFGQLSASGTVGSVPYILISSATYNRPYFILYSHRSVSLE